MRTERPGDSMTLRIGADDGVTVETLVSAVDGVCEREGKLLNSELVVGRFQPPKGDTTPDP